MKADTPDQYALAAFIMQSTGADVYFTMLVEATLRKLRVFMAAPARGCDETVDREFDAVRDVLGKFYAEYRQSYSALLVRHLQPALLTEAASVLGSEAALGYFGAMRKMEPELAGVFEELGARMLQHARYRAAG